MAKLLLDFIQFLNTLAPLFVALGVLTLLSVLLSKSIKKYAVIYYIAFALPFIPRFFALFGLETYNFSQIPFIGSITMDYVHAGTLGFPLLVIIMYMGALDVKIPWVKKLMSVRKELSIISGFPIFTHAIIRFNQGLNGFRFFIDNEGYMASGRVTSAWGAGISSFSFALGILMLALFILLWITSFDFVHKLMGGLAWKKVQRWSYVLYVMLFIHAMGIQVGGMLNPRGGGGTRRVVAEVTATTTERSEYGGRGNTNTVQPAGNSNDHAQATTAERRGGRGNRNAVQPPAGNGDNHTGVATAGHERGIGNTVQSAGNSNNTDAAQPVARGGRQQGTGFADITVSSQARRNIHIASLLLIFGSYLYLRLRKAKMNRARKQSLTTSK